MLRFVLLGMLSLASVCLPASAQQIGDSQEAVRAALGPPQMSRESSKGVIWLYGEGGRVTFKDGVVVAIEGVQAAGPAESAARPEVGATRSPARETVTVVPSPTLPPKPKTTQVALPVERSERTDTRSPAISPAKFGLMLLVLAGVVIVCVVSQIMILIKAFQAGIWWGLGSLFVPFVVLIFVACNWSDVKKPFLVNLAAAGALPVLGMIIL